MIKEFDTTNPDKSYNITKGGSGTNGWNPSEETRDKMSGSKVGNTNAISKPVICITTGRIFPSAREGAKYYNCDHADICKCCKGKRKSAGKLNGEKLIWKYLYLETL